MATDEQFDDLMSKWLEETAPSGLPQRALDATFDRTRKSGQQVRLGGLLRGIRVTRSTLALGGTAAIVIAAVLALGPRVGPPEIGKLPTTSDAWSRVSIDSSWDVAQVDAIVAGPRGLLAILGELGSNDMQLSVSTDGRTWSLVPNDQFPSSAVLWPPQGSRRLPAVVTTDGFLFVADGNDVWASDDGSTWQRRADRAVDPDLRAGAIHAVAAGGPGLIAVGSDNQAWYSEDGSDWTLAEVPAPPTESFAPEGYSAPTVDMQGIAGAGDALVAWGNAIAGNAAGDTVVEPVLWTSDDGTSWAKVSDGAGIGSLLDVAAGPDGLVAIDGDRGGIWFSADGTAWEPTDDIHADSGTTGLTVWSVAAAGSGYVATGSDDACAVEPCPGAVAVIWTSPDGRSWSRVEGDELFDVADPRTAPNHSGAWAMSAAAWGSHFVVAGAYDATPVIWISGTPTTTETALVKSSESVEPTASVQPSVDGRSSEPTVGQIECGNHAGNWSYPATSVQLNSAILGCSLDGSRVLIQKGNENLFVLDADGSETQVTEQLSGFNEIVGSARPTGATISPDGTRIVFAGLTTREGLSCHDGALFAVSADGGPAEVLWRSQVPQNGIVRDPSFSPDGTRIAFADGYCDSDHSVWVMNADGSDARQIVSSDFGPLGATHVHGLAWSAAGDRIALQVDDGTYIFATDDSGLASGSAWEFCWPGREC